MVIFMKVYTYEGTDYVHISEFAQATNRSLQSTRVLVEKGNCIRKLKAFRDGSRLMIPIKELYGFPFTCKGQGTSKEIFHYDEDGTRYLCEPCSYTSEKCAARTTADNLIVPEGDK